ncbi:MAG TPA: hypothetical protein VK463_13825 [Desulfomonilaceae bacterium]|nr:hypothetical protein [Desulfomonilaceae bacterium]
MGTNGNGHFHESELVSRKVKVGNEWQTTIFPVVGGRLRILHENNDQIGIRTEIVKMDNEFVVVRATVESQRGKFNGTGTASAQRDARLADSLVELAETRSIARALRFSGIGCEFTSAEEVSHVAGAEPEKEHIAIAKSKFRYDVVLSRVVIESMIQRGVCRGPQTSRMLRTALLKSLRLLLKPRFRVGVIFG